MEERNWPRERKWGVFWCVCWSGRKQGKPRL